MPPPGHLLERRRVPRAARPHWRVLADLFLLAMFGGFYSVPLYALIQSRSQPTHRARIIAANNILNSLFMIVSSLMAIALTSAGFSIPAIFLVTALLNVVVAIYIYSLVPEFLLRFIAWMLVHTFYRIRLVNAERIPRAWRARCSCATTSVSSTRSSSWRESPRPIRFVMDHESSRRRSPAGSSGTPRPFRSRPRTRMPQLLSAPTSACAQRACARANWSASFPRASSREPAIMNPFRHGVTRDHPAHAGAGRADGAARAVGQRVFSRKDDARWPRPIRRGVMSRLTLAVGEPIEPALATPEKLQDIVTELRGARK